MKKSEYYNGNVNIKKAGISQNLTKDEVSEFVKCKNDPIYFIKNYTKIVSLDDGLVLFDMYDYQERMVKEFYDNRFIINLLPRQTGKSTVVGAFLLHYALFNSYKNIGILANKASLAREILDRIKRMYEYLPFFLQVGVSEWNKSNVALGNGSNIMAFATGGDAVRGFTFNCVSGDTKIVICDDKQRIFNINIEDANLPKYTKCCNLHGEYMYYTVYKIKNKINNKEYIGYHSTDNLDDGYMGSGKLIKRAIEKYGIESFQKEYIDIFDNRDDAIALEALLVDKEYTLRNDTYNLNLGGNVRISVGKNNPFYGKTHTNKTKLKLSKIHSGRNTLECDDILVDGVKYNSWYHLKNKLKLSNGEIIKLLEKPGNRFINEELHNIFLTKLNNRREEISYNKSCITYEWLKRPKSEKHKKAISNALKGKSKTKEWVDKVNKNPIKIEKTAKKHRGMKRSAEAKEKMSLAKKGNAAHNKGKVYCYDPNSDKKLLCAEEDIPKGWKRGFRKCN